MSNGRPRFVEYGSLASAPGPLQCRGTELNMFLLKGGFLRLLATCSRVFARPSGYSVIPIPFGPFVIVSFGQIRTISAGGDYTRRGLVSERQIATWVPSFCLTPQAPGLGFVGMLVLNMWLDNPISVASGREQYGYPKSWGWGSFPREPDRRTGAGRTGRDGLSFDLEVPARAQHLPKTMLKERRLMRLEPTGGSPGPTPADEIDSGAAASKLIFDALVGERVAGEAADQADGGEPLPASDAGELELPLPAVDEELEGLDAEERADLIAALEAVAPTEMHLGRPWLRIPERAFDASADFLPPVNQTFLRQFRAPDNGEEASEQAVVSAPATVTAFHEASWLGPHRAQFTKLDSHPLGPELGLDGSIDVSLAIQNRFDFDVANGVLRG